MARPPRILLAKVGLDGHDVGVKVLARALRDAGCEVVYTGLRQSAEVVARAAVAEDVDAVGVSSLSGAHVALTRRVVEALRAAGRPDVPLLLGGFIPRGDVAAVRAAGAAAVFPAGDPLDRVVAAVRSLIGRETPGPDPAAAGAPPAAGDRAGDDGRIVREVAGGVWTLTIDRPARNNALSPGLCQDLRAALVAADGDPTARVVVVRGAGATAFCAGFDIGALRPGDPDAVERGNTALYAALDAVAGCRRPVVASIGGFALGAGLELAAACDVRVAADTAVFAMPAARVGVVYRWEGLVRIASVVGAAGAAELFLAARRIDAARARQLGLAQWVVPEAERETVTVTLAREIAGHAPLAVAGAKAMIARLRAALGSVAHEDLDALVRQARASEDFREGQRAFLEKRTPRFVGR
jgi:methylmalonyl-CoA mutase cobalamin-binding domain/chain